MGPWTTADFCCMQVTREQAAGSLLEGNMSSGLVSQPPGNVAWWVWVSRHPLLLPDPILGSGSLWSPNWCPLLLILDISQTIFEFMRSSTPGFVEAEYFKVPYFASMNTPKILGGGQRSSLYWEKEEPRAPLSMQWGCWSTGRRRPNV